MSSQLVSIPVPGADEPIMAVQHDDIEWVSVKHVCEALGISRARQQQKLNEKTWAVGHMMCLTAADGKNYQTYMVDRRTFTMWLATIDTNRVGEAARPILETYQKEAADALDAYFHEGGVINPRATEDQLTKLRDQIEWEAKLCQMMKGVVHPDHLDAKGRIILARAMGEAPQLEEKTRPIYVSDFLEEKGLTGKERRKVASTFGKRLKGAYVLEHGEDPGKYPQSLKNGQVRDVYAYTEADRPLMEAVWKRWYAAS